MPRLLLAAAALLAFSSLPAPADDPQAPALVRVRRSAAVPEAELDRAFREIDAQASDPQHLVVLIHGWDTPYFRSEEIYGRIAGDLRREFASHGERAAVIGVQWPSDAGPARRWVPRSLAHHLLRLLGFRNAVRDPYRRGVEIAREVGRGGVRQVLLRLQERYPEALLHVFVHSLGSEVLLHAADPIVPGREARTGAGSYRPGESLELGLVALAGADLDQDIARRHPGRARGRTRLIWITVPVLGARGDQVLLLRKLARGEPALGSGLPYARRDQLDQALTDRRVVFDTRAIPQYHHIREYYSPARIARLVDAASALREPQRPLSPLLRRLDAVLAAPAEAGVLRRFLEDPELSVKIYALWRLERLLCGSSKHLVDGYLRRVSRLGRAGGKRLEKEQWAGPCVTVRLGYWPSLDLLAGRMRRLRQADPAR